MPTLSILIPAFNNQKSLPSLIDCLLNQPFGSKDFEIVISPDDEFDYGCILPDDSRITYAPKGRCTGPGPARTRALRSARGKSITWIDADDMVDSRYLKHIFEGMEKFQAFATRLGYEKDGTSVRRLTMETLDISRLCEFYGSVPVVMPRAWLESFPDVVAEDVVASVVALTLNGGTLPVVNASYINKLNSESYCAQNGASFTLGYRQALMEIKSLVDLSLHPKLHENLTMMFETRLLMSQRFDQEFKVNPRADYHQFVKADARSNLPELAIA